MSSAIPVSPLPLSAAQSEVLQQRVIKKHHVAMMLLHWWNAAVWGLELLTGLALISSPHFRIAPRSYVSIVEGLFGSRAGMLQFHVALGVAWILVFLVYGIFGFRTYLCREVLEREVALDRDDWQWLRIRTLRLLGRSQEPLPPQGIYNAGQKLFALMVYLMLPVVMLSGLVMAFRVLPTWAVGWAVVFHLAAVGAVVSGLMVHLYMGAVFPEEKPAFFSMITGNVNELFAYSHHFKWWRQTMLARQEWDTRHDAEIARRAAEEEAAATSQPEAPPPGAA
jgi:formate dehydrogenase subunit gamma